MSAELSLAPATKPKHNARTLFLACSAAVAALIALLVVLLAESLLCSQTPTEYRMLGAVAFALATVGGLIGQLQGGSTRNVAATLASLFLLGFAWMTLLFVGMSQFFLIACGNPLPV